MDYTTMTYAQLKTEARKYGCVSLLNVDRNAKTVKGQKRNYLTGVLYMMPDDELCPLAAEAGCRKGCLESAGKGGIESVRQSRIGRVRLLRENPDLFNALLVAEIRKVIRKADREGLTPVIRLNGTSDRDWTNHQVEGGANVFSLFPEVQFYDYTKRPDILRKARMVPNYHVTASYSEVSPKYAAMIRAAADKNGANLAVVFPSRKDIPEVFMGKRVIDGDADDLRFTDEPGCVVALVAKGKARKDDSGFVIRRAARLIAAA